MKRQIARWPIELILLLLLAALTRLIGLDHPHVTVFDEVYFKSYAAAYFNHAYYFDVHPPLGKLLLAGWAWIIGLHPAGNSFTAPATSLRLLVALAGTSLVPLVYGIVRQLARSRLAASLAGLFITLDGALIVESRLVLLNTFLLFFGIAAVYCALKWQERSAWWMVLAGLSAGAAMSVKWTGLTALLLVVLVCMRAYYKRLVSGQVLLSKIFILMFCSLFVYVGTFWIHFHLLDRSGTGDEFMSVEFQSTLHGSQYYDPAARMSFTDKFLEANHEMYVANATLTATHPYSSPWYSWPVEERPIYYWAGERSRDGGQGNRQLPN